jgi:hypothetical protein
MAELARPAFAKTMSKAVDELLQSIMAEFAAGKMQKALEAKALFRLLNYCPPPALEIRETSASSKGERSEI